MNIKPLNDRVLIKQSSGEEKTAGGLFIPDSAKEKPQEAVILAVGNGEVMSDGSIRKLDVSVGDLVLYSKYAGTEVKIDGDDCMIVRESDLLAIISR